MRTILAYAPSMADSVNEVSYNLIGAKVINKKLINIIGYKIATPPLYIALNVES